MIIKLREIFTIHEYKDDLAEWRKTTINYLANAIAIIMVVPLLFLYYDVYQNPQRWQAPFAFTIIYLIALYIAVNKNIAIATRGWGLIGLGFVSEIVDLAQGGLVGDARIWLIAMPIVAFVIINIQAGWILGIINIFLFSLFGYFHNLGIFDEIYFFEGSPQPLQFWLMDGTFLFAMMGAVIVLLTALHQFLLTTIDKEKRSATEFNRLNDNLEKIVDERTAELMVANNRLAYLANHDFLTGIPNRKLFFERLDDLIQNIDNPEYSLYCLFIDLDNFKLVNDNFGHAAGDKLLKEIGVRLAELVSESDIVARLGGDEFVVILENVETRNQAEQKVEKIMREIQKSYQVQGEDVLVTACAGISVYPQNSKDVYEIVHFADEAMYASKREGEKQLTFYSDL